MARALRRWDAERMSTAIDPVAYGRLLAAELPKKIANDEEFDRAVERLEALSFAGRELSPEERAYDELLAILIEDYDSRKYPMPGEERD